MQKNIEKSAMRAPNKKRNLIATLVLAAIVLLLTWRLDSIPAAERSSTVQMIIPILQKSLVYALVAVSMNMLNGFTGLFSLGQAGFMLIGAVVYGVLTNDVAKREMLYMYVEGGVSPLVAKVHVGFFAAIILGGLAAALCAWLIGKPVLKLKSDYLAIATLGFAEIVRAVVQSKELAPITNGSNMIKNIPSFTTIMFPLIAVTICIAIIVLLLNSTYGRAFKAIREDEIAAEAMGINLAHHKLLSFVISSFFAGVSGALYAMFLTMVQAKGFTIAMTYEFLLIVVIGGIGSITGSIIGSFLYVASSEWWLRFLDNETYIGTFKVPFLRTGFRMLIFSIIIMVVVLFYRRGIMGNNEFSWDAIFGLFKRKGKVKVDEKH